MLDPEVRLVLDGTSIAHLATVLPDGSPHTTRVYVGTHGDRVVLFTGPGMRKARNLRRDPRAALSIAPPPTRSSPWSSEGGSPSGSRVMQRGRSSIVSPRSTPGSLTPEARNGLLR